MDNYVIIVIILLSINNIIYFSLTSDNRNRQLSCNNRDREIFAYFQCNIVTI